uniref:hypothetical protein n=1 Tax=unclassified Variovorax TaxID=663243 RepID=UPI000D39B3FC
MTYGAINTAFALGLVYGALIAMGAGALVRGLLGVMEFRARRAVLVALARRRSAEATRRHGVARSAPDGNHGENLQHPTAVAIDG